MKIEKRYRVSVRVPMLESPRTGEPMTEMGTGMVMYKEIFSEKIAIFLQQGFNHPSAPPDIYLERMREKAKNYPHCHVHVEEYYYVE